MNYTNLYVLWFPFNYFHNTMTGIIFDLKRKKYEFFDWVQRVDRQLCLRLWQILQTFLFPKGKIMIENQIKVNGLFCLLRGPLIISYNRGFQTLCSVRLLEYQYFLTSLSLASGNTGFTTCGISAWIGPVAFKISALMSNSSTSESLRSDFDCSLLSSLSDSPWRNTKTENLLSIFLQPPSP